MTGPTAIGAPRPAPARPARRLAGALVLACCPLAAPAAGHEFWLMPETFEPRPGVPLGVRLFVGDGFENGQPYPRNPLHIKEFKAVSTTVTEIGGSPGADPAGTLTPTEPGVLALLYRSYPSRLTLEAGPFERHLREEGLEHVSRARAAAGETAEPGREAFSRCAKSLLRVGGGREGWDRRVGLDLEIVPLSSPFELAADAALPVQVLWLGEPLAGAQLRAFVEGHPDRTLETRTGADGTARLELRPAGVWMLSVVHMEAAEPGSGVDWRSTWSSLTFETATANQVGAGLPEGLVVSLSGTEPDEARSSPDLELLAGWLGDARVVGLGESLHGVQDFHRLAHRIFAHLVEHQGFDVFALEISQAHAARLDEFVQGRRDDLDTLMAERWWTAKAFYGRALRELLLWMRRHNEVAESPIHFGGFDFKQPSFAMEAVVEEIRRLDPGAADEVSSLYSTVLGLGGLGVYPNVYGFSATLDVPLPARTGTTTLRARLQARGRGVSHGSIGISVEGVASGSGIPLDSRYAFPGELSDAWTPLELEVEVAADVDEIRLEIFHRGNGTVWFDGLGAALDGEPLDLAEGLEGIRARPLHLPRIQVMDYRSSFDERVTYAGGRSLRVECDPAIDEALRAARRAHTLLEAALDKGSVPSSRRAWSTQMSRLVVQATEYRALVENDRDVFLAENVAWLQRRGFPGSRVLALAHSSHTNRRARGKGMGLLLASEYGDLYKTVTMLALSGQLNYFDTDLGAQAADAGLKLQPLRAGEAGPLEQLLASLGPGDLLFHLAAATESTAVRERLDLEKLPVRDVADVAILLRSVRPLLVP